MKEAVEDLVLTPPPEPKRNHHITVALNHMRKQRDKLTAKIDTLTAERDALDRSIAEIE